jgi:topoisomerase-4 subunit A
LRKLVVKELEADARQYGDARRTVIKSEERAAIERTVVEEPVTVILSAKGWVRARSGHGIDLSAVSFKDGDARHLALECKTTDAVSVLSASGKCFTLDAAALPSGRGDGAPVNTLVNSGSDDIVWIGVGAPEAQLLMANTAGNGFLCQLGDLATKTRQGKDFMAVPEGARALAPVPADGGRRVAALSSDARLLVFALDEVPARPNGGVGVQLIALPESVSLAAVAVSDGRSLAVSGVRRKNRAVATLDAKALAAHEGRRAQRGKLCDIGFRPDRLGG